MILILGGTGRLGSLVANRLAAQGRHVRVVSRGLVPPVVPLHEQVEQVLGDVRDRTRMQELVAGAEVVVLAMHGFVGPGGVSPRTVDQQGSRNVIAAAERADADVVMLSIAGASATSPLELARVKYSVEVSRWQVCAKAGRLQRSRTGGPHRPSLERSRDAGKVLRKRHGRRNSSVG